MGIDGGFFFVVFLFIAGAFLFGHGFHLLRLRKMIKGMPTSKIRSVAMGLCEVSGKVVPIKEDILTTPITKKPCVYYSFRLEELRQSGKSSRWVTLKSGTKYAIFHLKDSTGMCLVNPKDAEIVVSTKFKADSGIGKSFPQVVKDYLKEQHISYGGFLGIHNAMRVYEEYIPPKTDLFIIGTADDNPLTEIGEAKKSEENILVSKGKKEKFFYITDQPESDVVSRFMGRMIVSAVSGLVLMGVSLFVILIYLRLI